MNDIDHKQAIEWIDQHVDDLLGVEQRFALDQHLRSCESCRAYAADMDGLSAHLQSQFQARWDGQPGPPQDMVRRVTTKTGRIRRTDRVLSGLRLVGGAAAMIVLALLIDAVMSRWRGSPTDAPTREVATSVPLLEGGVLAFPSDQTGDSDIYTIHPDGSGMTNLTDHPAHDSSPAWSPDGMRIAFESNRDGFNQIYLMNADGSGVTQLTHDEADHFIPMNIHNETNPWSPEGTRLLFLQQEPGIEGSTLYSLDITSGATVWLANGHVQFNNLSWSPDGRYVGYVLNDSPTPDAAFATGMYVVDTAGNNTIAINNLLPPGDVVDKPFYSWSRDGSSISFIAYRNPDGATDQWIAYEAVLDNQQLFERATSSTIMESWWAGTSLVADYEAGVYSLTWLRPDGTSNTFQPLGICDLTLEADNGFLLRRSPNGNQVINIYCPNKDMWFYYASSDGTIIKPLANSPIPSITADGNATTINWSSDDRFIAVTLVSPTKSSLYILDVNHPASQPQEFVMSAGELYAVPAWRPVPGDSALEESPTP